MEKTSVAPQTRPSKTGDFIVPLWKVVRKFWPIDGKHCQHWPPFGLACRFSYCFLPKYLWTKSELCESLCPALRVTYNVVSQYSIKMSWGQHKHDVLVIRKMEQFFIGCKNECCSCKTTDYHVALFTSVDQLAEASLIALESKANGF